MGDGVLKPQFDVSQTSSPPVRWCLWWFVKEALEPSFCFAWEGWEEPNWSGNEQPFTDSCQEGKGANFTVGLEHLATISRWAMESTAQRAKLSFRVQQHLFRCQAAMWPEGALHPQGALGTPSSPARTPTSSWQAPPRGLRHTAAERPAGLCHFTPLGKGRLFVCLLTLCCGEFQTCRNRRASAMRAAPQPGTWVGLRPQPSSPPTGSH